MTRSCLPFLVPSLPNSGSSTDYATDYAVRSRLIIQDHQPPGI